MIGGGQAMQWLLGSIRSNGLLLRKNIQLANVLDHQLYVWCCCWSCDYLSSPALSYIQGGFFNWSARFSVPKWKNLLSQQGAFLHWKFREKLVLVVDLIEKNLPTIFLTFGNVWNILWILCQVALSLPWHQWLSRLDLQQRWYKPTWRYERWTKPTWRYSWWVKQHDLNNINIFASVDILWDRH